MAHRGRPRKGSEADVQIERGMDLRADLDAAESVLDNLRYLIEVQRRAARHRNAYFEAVRGALHTPHNGGGRAA